MDTERYACRPQNNRHHHSAARWGWQFNIFDSDWPVRCQAKPPPTHYLRWCLVVIVVKFAHSASFSYQCRATAMLPACSFSRKGYHFPDSQIYWPPQPHSSKSTAGFYFAFYDIMLEIYWLDDAMRVTARRGATATRQVGTNSPVEPVLMRPADWHARWDVIASMTHNWLLCHFHLQIWWLARVYHRMISPPRRFEVLKLNRHWFYRRVIAFQHTFTGDTLSAAVYYYSPCSTPIRQH